MHTASRQLFVRCPGIARRRPAFGLVEFLRAPGRAYAAGVLFTVLVALALGLWQYDFYSYQATNIGQMDLSTLDRGVVYWT
ncbi:MAG TPA: hypothetical protein VMX74_02060, partial [Pirellulales bacterium]|nr:hypothetical protein [Pirellulales bacterium]